MNYAYAIALPGMLDGLEPDLTLDYSSAAADQAIKDSPILGTGWSFEPPKISQGVNVSSTTTDSSQFEWAVLGTYFLNSAGNITCANGGGPNGIVATGPGTDGIDSRVPSSPATYATVTPTHCG